MKRTLNSRLQRGVALFALGTCFALACSIKTGVSQEGPSPFAAFVDDYFDAYFNWRPSDGTAAGLHQYDTKLEDRSAAAVARRIDEVQALQNRLEKLRSGK